MERLDLKLAIVGDLGHGKSTLADALQGELALIDVPGEPQLLQSMVSGAASADAALLVVDAHEDVQQPTRRHARLLRLLGVRRLVVALNKMDLAGYAEARFAHMREELAAYFAAIGVGAGEALFVPVSAREGENLRRRSSAMPWHAGPTLLEALDALLPPPPHVASLVSNVFRARLFWLGRAPLRPGTPYRLRHGAAETPACIERIERVIDLDDRGVAAGDELGCNGVAEVLVRTRAQLALDDAGDNPLAGRFVLLDGACIVGGGSISTAGLVDPRRAAPKSANLFHVEHRVAAGDRARRNGHRGAILWFTGLSGAGKSTLALELERLLFARGHQVFLLDGDNVRGGLNADLGFSPEDRAENIRRVGEVAGLFAEAGMIVVTAFISPYRADRDRVRGAHRGCFHEVYINASLEVCEKRDTKGLYRKARAGQLKEFTGISAPYEPPLAPELEIRSGEWPLARCLAELMLYVQRRLELPSYRRAVETTPGGA